MLRSLAWIALVPLLACAEERHELLVTVRSDLVPVEEFAAVEVVLERGEDEVRRQRTPVFAIDRPIAGLSVADFRDLSPGDYHARVRLVHGSGEPLLERVVQLSLERNYHFSVAMTRDCRAIMCPAEAGDPAHTTCRGGRCVDPRCTAEDTTHCDGVQCTRAQDCPALHPCAAPRCEEGVCLAAAPDDACAADEWCDPDRGCRPRTTSAATEDCPDPCSPVGPICGCGAGSACRVGTEGNFCGDLGASEVDAPCEADGECLAGLGCNRFGNPLGTCARYCRRNADCPGTVCSILARSVPVGACLPKCDPVANTGCPPGLDCLIVPVLDLEERIVPSVACAVAGDNASGEACDSALSCVGGAVCLDGTCRDVCHVARPACASCRSFDPPAVLDDAVFGFCP